MAPGPSNPTVVSTDIALPWRAMARGMVSPPSASARKSSDATVPAVKIDTSSPWVAASIGVKCWPLVRFVTLTR